MPPQSSLHNATEAAKALCFLLKSAKVSELLQLPPSTLSINTAAQRGLVADLFQEVDELNLAMSSAVPEQDDPPPP
jgi:hypothetical protein